LLKSPIVSLLTESITGTSTIRAFGYQQTFIDNLIKLVNKDILSRQMGKGIFQYFKLRLNTTATFFVALICAICIISRDSPTLGKNGPIWLGLLLTYSLGIQNNLTIMLNITSTLEAKMINA
jgi:ABC-type multidrug transport system fused ATPase/permease subunit